MKVPHHSFRLRFVEDGIQGRGVGRLYGPNAAEMLQQSLPGTLADAGNFQQF